MATIKLHTDLPQSKKLAEILPLENADMYWRSLNINGHISWSSHIKRLEPPIYDLKHYIPCWSLSALISIIPQELFDGEYIINITEGKNYKWIITYDHYVNREHSHYGLSSSADNLVDACTDIIIKLKERNII